MNKQVFYPESHRKFFESGVLAMSRSGHRKRQYFFVPPNMAPSSVRCSDCFLDIDPSKVKLSVTIFFLQIHGTNDGPLK